MGFAIPLIVAAGVAGAATTAVGAVQQGDAASANANYQSQVARNNAAIAAQNESWTSASGAAKEAAQGMKTRQAAGQIKSTQGASGIDVNTGSAATVQGSEAKLGELDAMTIRSNTARNAYGYAVEGESDTAESELLTSEAGQEQTAGYLSGAGDFLSGVSSVGSKWAGLQNQNPNA